MHAIVIDYILVYLNLPIKISDMRMKYANINKRYQYPEPNLGFVKYSIYIIVIVNNIENNKEQLNIVFLMQFGKNISARQITNKNTRLYTIEYLTCKDIFCK